MTSRPSILVLEDDPEWFEIVSTCLGENYRLVHACSLSEAAGLLRSETFSLIILDLNLSDAAEPDDRSGFQIIEVLYRAELQASTAVLVLSRYDEGEELRTAFKQYGVYDFISKRHFLDMPFVELVDEAVSSSHHSANRQD